MRPPETRNVSEERWHTRKWYKENFGIDPAKLDLHPIQKKNPYYSTAAPMKLWRESDVLPFKDDKGIKTYAKRKEAGKKAHETRKNHLKDWFVDIKNDNPTVGQILNRLWEIGERISDLHAMKEDCRGSAPYCNPRDYFDHGIEHCKECEKLTEEQCELREEREGLFMELEYICDRDKETIQLARKYLREQKQSREALE
jgi:hypothetical protein